MPAASREEVQRCRGQAIAEHGRWTAYNIDLGHGVFSIAEGQRTVAEERVDQIRQIVCDFASKSLGELRILDLGANEGGFAIDLARRQARVVAVEARLAHVAKIRVAKQTLGLDRLEARQGDIRELDVDELGRFDVALCLGVIYHLDVPDVFSFVTALAAMAPLAIVETQVSLKPARSVSYAGETYWGRYYDEGSGTDPGASFGNARSFWFTEPSLLNLLASNGYTSVARVAMPVVSTLASYRDHVVLIAARGQPAGRPPQRWPERLPALAHPQQGTAWWLRERLQRARGRGLASVFDKK